MPVPDHPDCLGLAMDFVNTRGRAAEVLKNILGRTLIVRDHASARELLSAIPDSGRLVTMNGDVFLPSGHVLVGLGYQAERELDQSEGMSRSLKAKAMFMGLPTLVGSYQTIADYFDRMAEETEVVAVMLAFPDFTTDLNDFFKHVWPRLQCRERRS